MNVFMIHKNTFYILVNVIVLLNHTIVTQGISLKFLIVTVCGCDLSFKQLSIYFCKDNK